jgi:hypothetical protein
LQRKGVVLGAGERGLGGGGWGRCHRIAVLDTTCEELFCSTPSVIIFTKMEKYWVCFFCMCFLGTERFLIAFLNKQWVKIYSKIHFEERRYIISIESHQIRSIKTHVSAAGVTSSFLAIHLLFRLTFLRTGILSDIP